MKPVRLHKRRVWWPLAVAAPLALGAGWLLSVDEDAAPPGRELVRTLRTTAPPPVASAAPVPSALPPPPADPAALSRVVTDASRSLDERAQALRTLARASHDPAPVLRLLGRTVSGGDDAQVRAMALTALARYPEHPLARSASLQALGSDRPREERLLALSVVRGMIVASDDRTWARATLEALTTDPDLQVARAARAAIEAATN